MRNSDGAGVNNRLSAHDAATTACLSYRAASNLVAGGSCAADQQRAQSWHMGGNRMTMQWRLMQLMYAWALQAAQSVFYCTITSPIYRMGSNMGADLVDTLKRLDAVQKQCTV